MPQTSQMRECGLHVVWPTEPPDCKDGATQDGTLWTCCQKIVMSLTTLSAVAAHSDYTVLPARFKVDSSRGLESWRVWKRYSTAKDCTSNSPRNSGYNEPEKRHHFAIGQILLSAPARTPMDANGIMLGLFIIAVRRAI